MSAGARPWQVRLVPRLLSPESVASGSLMIASLHGIGDNIMLTPAVRTLKQLHPRLDIALLVRGAAAAEIWQDNPHVSRVLRFQGREPVYWHPNYQFVRRHTLARELRAVATREGYAAVVHVTGLTWPTMLMRTLGMPHKQRITTAQLGVEPDSFRTDLPLRDEHRAAAAALFPPDAAPTVALNRTSSQHLRYWSLREYERLASALAARGFRVLHCYSVAARSLEERADGRRARRVAGDATTEDLTDARFLTTAATLERCVAVVSVDSALMHVGLAFGKPTIGLFTWPILMNGAAFGPNLRVLHGQPRAEAVLAALETALGPALAPRLRESVA